MYGELFIWFCPIEKHNSNYGLLLVFFLDCPIICSMKPETAIALNCFLPRVKKPRCIEGSRQGEPGVQQRRDLIQNVNDSTQVCEGRKGRVPIGERRRKYVEGKHNGGTKVQRAMTQSVFALHEELQHETIHFGGSISSFLISRSSILRQR